MDILNFYYIDLKYIRNLSRADDNVMSVSPQVGKENRPFLGIIILIGGQKYCIPLTSPKKKFENMKSQIDFIKIFRAFLAGKRRHQAGMTGIEAASDMRGVEF